MISDEAVLQEMIDVSEGKKTPLQTGVFTGSLMSHDEIWQVCNAVLNWILFQPPSSTVIPFELHPKSDVDLMCVNLISQCPSLQTLFVAQNNQLNFAESISPDRIGQIIQYVQDNYHPDVLIDVN